MNVHLVILLLWNQTTALVRIPSLLSSYMLGVMLLIYPTQILMSVLVVNTTVMYLPNAVILRGVMSVSVKMVLSEMALTAQVNYYK